jgi:regulator of cell morphogenesis and NO signaling
MKELTDRTLADIVSEHNCTAKVFDKYRFDFCENGDEQLKSSIAEAGVNSIKVLEEIEEAITKEDSDNINFNELSIAELSEVIRNEYHEYLRHKISELTTLSRKVQQTSSSKIIDQIHELIVSFFNHLAPHMLSEEKVLFPYLEYMEHMVEQKKVAKPASFGKLKKTVTAMLDDHKDSTDKLNQLRDLTSNYKCLDKDDSDLKHLYKELRLLDSNLRMHIHIENNVLFKKARAMEETMIQQSN